MGLTTKIVEKYLPQILTAIPSEWRGTTFNNSDLLGREKFSERLSNLMTEKSSKGETITTEDLIGIGNAEEALKCPAIPPLVAAACLRCRRRLLFPGVRHRISGEHEQRRMCGRGQRRRANHSGASRLT